MTTARGYRRGDLDVPAEEARIIVPGQRPPPPSDSAVCWSWSVADAVDLSLVRRELRDKAAATQYALEPAADDPVMAGAVERLLLAFSELTTNGLRHARPPVDVVVTRSGDAWLVVVSDPGSDVVPVRHAPDPRRAGQHGLVVVAAVSGATGWFARDGSKHVWATIPDVAPAVLLERLTPRA